MKTNKRYNQYQSLVYATQVNSAFRALWLVNSEVISRYYSPPLRWIIVNYSVHRYFTLIITLIRTAVFVAQLNPLFVGCLWQATERFRRIFFFFVDAKRQIWLTSNYILRKILWFSQAVACADSVVLEATCTSTGNKQKVRNFKKDCVSTLCVELKCENCKEFADHPFRFKHRTNEFTVYLACQTKQRVL